MFGHTLIEDRLGTICPSRKPNMEQLSKDSEDSRNVDDSSRLNVSQDRIFFMNLGFPCIFVVSSGSMECCFIFGFLGTRGSLP